MGRLKYLFILFISQVIFSQKQPEISSFIENILELRFKENLEIAQRLDNKYFLLLTKIIEDDRQSNLKDLDTNFINLKNRNEKLYDEYLYHLIKGYEYLNYNKNRIESYNSYENSYLIAKKKEDKSLIKLSLFAILNFYLKGLLQNDGDFKVYLKEYKSLCISPTDWLYYYSFKFNLISQTEIYDEKKSLYDIKHNKIFKSYDSLIDNSKIIKPLFYYYKDKANFIIRQNPTLAKAYYLKSKSLHTESNFYKFHNFNSLINLSRISSLTKNYKEGIKFLYKAQNYISVNDSLLDIFDISIHKANHYFNLKRFDSAFFYENKSRNLGYLVNFQKHNTEVSKIKIELETERKGKENLQLKQDNLEIESKRKQNRDLLIGSFLFIFLGGIIITLAFKSSKRKRKVAQKEAELEIQKNLTLLKEKEITTINAMIDGQEKERKRIAEDLHDNLGSVLATLKLHFENIKMNREKNKINPNTLFDKTENLIDEAYLKVRSIAHAKNAGVIANQGLLVAIQMMAEKISSADKIQIEVIDFGLDKRIENSLEISVFRITQELITNVIKHADAKNVTINISLYDKNLNIIIEDDGLGFDINKVNLKNGMGISSIKTRVKYLKGTFEIDSTKGKGTSIIINIPIT